MTTRAYFIDDTLEIHANSSDGQNFFTQVKRKGETKLIPLLLTEEEIHETISIIKNINFKNLPFNCVHMIIAGGFRISIRNSGLN